MKNTQTIKLNREFKRLYYKGKFCARGCIVVYAMKTRRRSNRLGLTAGKSVGNAVKRNRAKRLMRECYRLSKDKLKSSYDIVIVARASICGKKLDAVMRDVLYAFKKTGVM
jgi:ribonuclease P protein component